MCMQYSKSYVFVSFPSSGLTKQTCFSRRYSDTFASTTWPMSSFYACTLVVMRSLVNPTDVHKLRMLLSSRWQMTTMCWIRW